MAGADAADLGGPADYLFRHAARRQYQLGLRARQQAAAPPSAAGVPRLPDARPAHCRLLADASPLDAALFVATRAGLRSRATSPHTCRTMTSGPPSIDGLEFISRKRSGGFMSANEATGKKRRHPGLRAPPSEQRPTDLAATTAS